MRTVTVLYFAWIRERMGCSEERLSLDDEIVTLDDLIDHLKARDERGAEAFENRMLVRAGLDQDHASLDTAIGDAREIAFFPPVTGG